MIRRALADKPGNLIKGREAGTTGRYGSGRDGFGTHLYEVGGFCRQTNFENPEGAARFAVEHSCQGGARLPRPDSEEDYIVIPPMARDWELSDFPLSARLKNILAIYQCQRLGDLHGLRFSRVLRWRNVGRVTLRTLIAFLKSVQSGRWGVGLKPDPTAWPKGQGI